MLNQFRFLVFAFPLLLFVFIKPEFTHGQDVQQRLQIPKVIVAEAKRRLIPLTAIRLSGKKWIACIENHSQGESCITLGEDVPALSSDADIKPPDSIDTRSILLSYGDQISIERYGQQALEIPILPGAKLAASVAEFGTLTRESDEFLRFEIRSNCEARVSVTGRSGRRSFDALPRFRRESSRLVRTSDLGLVSKYMGDRIDEPYLVVVTVPSHCEPCRRMDQIIGRYHESEQPGVEKIKTFILEYFSFSDAENAILGRGAIFPTTIVFPKYSEQPKSSLPSLAIGFSQVNGMETFSKQLGNGFKRAPSGIARGVLSPESLHEVIRTAGSIRY